MPQTAFDRFLEKHDTLGIFVGFAILALASLALGVAGLVLKRFGLLEAVALIWVGAAVIGAVVVGLREYFRR